MQKVVEVQKKLEGVFAPAQAAVLAEVITEAYSELVKTSDFNELKEIVRDLGIKMGELAEAQKRTEVRVSRLEEVVVELAEAQKRTEDELRKLVAEHQETRKQLGGLSNTVGYRLEDEAFEALPELLKRDFGLAVQGRLKRQFIKDNQGAYIEVNIIGEALENGEKVTIIGESKSQLSKNNVDEFLRKKLKRLEGIFPKVLPVLVTYMISEPDAEEYAKEKGVKLYYSYNF